MFGAGQSSDVLHIPAIPLDIEKEHMKLLFGARDSFFPKQTVLSIFPAFCGDVPRAARRGAQDRRGRLER
jgi:hypothetical protein